MYIYIHIYIVCVYIYIYGCNLHTENTFYQVRDLSFEGLDVGEQEVGQPLKQRPNI
jgi:hypothetical protein